MKIDFKVEDVDFAKGNGLVPAVIQDYATLKVLMLGYMNKESLELTLKEKKVTFYSRSRKTLWTKGETSGNFLIAKEMYLGLRPRYNTCESSANGACLPQRDNFML
jgi:phosphoribosyl-ATP pyrophosphohydrolase/phosphoribosyl-AMP cyclohydrolase